GRGWRRGLIASLGTLGRAVGVAGRLGGLLGHGASRRRGVGGGAPPAVGRGVLGTRAARPAVVGRGVLGTRAGLAAVLARGAVGRRRVAGGRGGGPRALRGVLLGPLAGRRPLRRVGLGGARPDARRRRWWGAGVALLPHRGHRRRGPVLGRGRRRRRRRWWHRSTGWRHRTGPAVGRRRHGRRRDRRADLSTLIVIAHQRWPSPAPGSITGPATLHRR